MTKYVKQYLTSSLVSSKKITVFCVRGVGGRDGVVVLLH